MDDWIFYIFGTAIPENKLPYLLDTLKGTVLSKSC